MASERIGIAGTGRMGTAYARRLMETGHAVTVWNRSRERTAEAEGAGARVAATPAELVEASGVVLTSLTDFAALERVYDGLLAGEAGGKLFVEMSTILPEQQEALAERARAAEASYVECPVGGTVGPALKGALLGLAGGRPEDYERARPVLEDLCKRVELLGPVGTGAAMKLAVNLPLAVYWATLGEALKLVSGAGLGGQAIASLLADSSAGPNVLRNRLTVVAETIDGADHPGTFDIDGLSKDLSLALDWAARRGAPMPVSETVRRLYAEASAAGLGGCDGASLSRLLAGR